MEKPKGGEKTLLVTRQAPASHSEWNRSTPAASGGSWLTFKQGGYTESQWHWLLFIMFVLVLVEKGEFHGHCRMKRRDIKRRRTKLIASIISTKSRWHKEKPDDAGHALGTARIPEGRGASPTSKHHTQPRCYEGAASDLGTRRAGRKMWKGQRERWQILKRIKKCKSFLTSRDLQSIYTVWRTYRQPARLHIIKYQINNSMARADLKKEWTQWATSKVSRKWAFMRASEDSDKWQEREGRPVMKNGLTKKWILARL